MSPASGTAFAQLSSIVGEANYFADPAVLVRYAVDGRNPDAVVRPGSAAEVAEVVRFAAGEKLALIACGGRSKLGVGMPPVCYDIAIDLSRMNRVVTYDPGDLTLGVEGGMPVSALLERLREKNQWLPLLVPWLERATIGGILSSNSVSPLRYMFGGPRDFLLGLEFVTGDGKLCKSGARVVKSVAGYDSHKLLLGALGSLGIITRANFRTFPLPRTRRGFVASYSDAVGALDFCRRIAQSSLKPAVVEVLDPGAARILASPRLPENSWCVVVAAIGHEPVVERHARDLEQLAAQSRAGTFVALTDADKQELLGRVREFLHMVGEQHPNAAVLRTGVLPQNVAANCEKIARLAAQNGLACANVVRAGAVLYTVLLPGADGATERLEAAVRSAMSSTGGMPRTVLEQCPTETKSRVDVWGPVGPDMELMKRVKQVFDPHGILSPGRFVGGL